MVFGGLFYHNETEEEELEGVVREIRKEVESLQAEQKKQTDQLEMLVSQAQSIGKAVVCGERRQDKWAGAVIKQVFSRSEL